MQAVCFKCGEQKRRPFDICTQCSSKPTSASQRTVSLALSTCIASEAQLATYKDEIEHGAKPSIPMGALSKAIEGLKSGLGSEPDDASDSITCAESGSRASGQAFNHSNNNQGKPDSGWVWKPFGTSIDNVPFAVLGATPRDTSKRIVALAEELSLELDPAVCQKARSDLTHPRTRLSAELAWFPGLSPGKIVKCLGALNYDPMSVRSEAGLPVLAHFNLMIYSLEMVNSLTTEDAIASFLCEATNLANDIDVDSVLRDINEDRHIARFPPVNVTEQVETALSERKDCCRDVVKRALNKLPSVTLVHVLTKAVASATDSGRTSAPKMLDDLIDSYAVEVQATLDTGALRIRKMIDAVKSAVGSSKEAVDAKIALLEGAIRKWDLIAQPIQLSAKARGTEHELSTSLAREIRSLAVDLFNEHGLLEQAQRITRLLRDVFAELPEIVELVDKDAKYLDEVAERKSAEHELDPIRSRCEEATHIADTNPSGAYLEAHMLLKEGLSLLEAASIDAGSPAYKGAEDMLAGACMYCAIEYANKTSNWEPCIELLERALQLASDTSLCNRINENLATAKSNYTNIDDCYPINKAPSLHTVNGIGFTLYGSTDPKPGGSHMSTYYFVILGIPIFPIARYRVIPMTGGYRFLGKGKLRTLDKWHLGISLAVIGWLFLLAMN